MRPDPPAETTPELSARWEWLYLATTGLIIIGLFIDGWSHGHVSRAGEGLLTPWHWTIYGGYIASALVLFMIVERHRVPGAGWRGAAPRGYGYAVVVTFLFPLAAGLDLVWHGLFGVESGIEGLLSPTHILLISCASLMVGASFRSWSLADPRWLAADRYAVWRAVLSLTSVVAAIEFVLRYSNPLSSLFGIPGSDPNVTFGVTGFLLHSVVYAGAVAAMLQRRVPLPFGAFTVVFLCQAVGVGILANTMPLCVVTALAAGLTADLIALAVGRRGLPADWLIVVPGAAVAALWTSYFVYQFVRHGIVWSVHVWTGTIVISTIVGLLISLLALRRVGGSATGTADP